ncbi:MULTISPECIES: helicase-related protein [Spirulina sp. CCY15215]|uniref:helicase-related protein n=1 Tax=Spirulina sp. CCY15215 TaxID=2767591 RepID=UPI00194F5E0C|nr:helicase-related protein [Spirulina major]
MQNNGLNNTSVWGRVFEISVQRGILAYLIHSQLLDREHPQFSDWKETKINQLIKQLFLVLQVTDENSKQWIQDYVRYLLIFGYGLGWSTLRECFKHQFNFKPAKKMKLEAIWCPLTLPGVDDPRFAEDPQNIERQKTILAFCEAFKLPTIEPSIVNKGYPARADFLLWLSPRYSETKRRKDDYILCFEFSYNGLREFKDFSREISHCEEIARYARYLDSRGSFSRICAEVKDDNLDFSKRLKNHLIAFSSRDKPLYKLCQSSSYTDRLLTILYSQKRLQNPCEARAMAITSNGLESLAVHFTGNASESDSRIQLLRSLGAAYREMKTLGDDDPTELDREIKLAFKKLLISLPKAFKEQVKPLLNKPSLTHNIDFDCHETVEDYFQPMQSLDRTTIIQSIEETEALTEFFDTSPREYINRFLQQDSLPLRSVHAATIEAGLNAAKKGCVNAIALEGNPGIGKTTAVVSYLKKQTEGFLFLYASPRVAINRDVTQKLAREEGECTGILTLTSSAKLIGLAKKYYQSKNKKSKRSVDTMAVVDGLKDFKDPESNILFVTPEEEREINENIIDPRRWKKSANEREYLMETKRNPGVLRTLARSARLSLEANPKCDRVVITAATQGYRKLDQKTTIKALGELFKNSVDKKPGIKERQDFSRRISTIIVMVDEIAGDSAGALFVREIANFLQQQFIDPFERKTSPFRVVLVLADASLSNEIVLDNFINSGTQSRDRVPDKVLISRSRGESPFRVTGSYLKLGNRTYPTLHVMTNSYPATELKIDYRIRLSSISPALNSDGNKQSIARAIREQSEDLSLENSYREIKRAVNNKAGQIIFFAQDKAFLRELQTKLTEGDEKLFHADRVAVLDQSVPAAKKQELISEPRRDEIRLFLMTSSGSRGISFPLADWIIASFPRFNIESSLMEIAQLIYRGRGEYTDPVTLEKKFGDARSRRLVFFIHDFFIVEDREEEIDRRQWLRQASDILTLLLMLRSTIYTRIKGDAGLQQKRIAFVPVGGVGSDELLNLIAKDVQEFLKEARVFMSDKRSESHKGMVKNAMELVEEQFGDLNLLGLPPKENTPTYVDYQTLENLTKSVSSPSNRLLPNLKDTTGIIPENIACIGPFWLENWCDRPIREQYNFQGSTRNSNNNHNLLISLLYRVSQTREIPNKLRRFAGELHQLLNLEQTEEMREYSTLQDMNTRTLAIALPLDYPYFLQEAKEGDEYSRKQELEEPQIWHQSLSRSLIPRGIALPAIRRYKRFPWAAVAGRPVLSQLDTVFDNRYFMISNELNLLNTILLEDVEE